MNNYTLSKQEELMAVIVKSYKANHPDAGKDVFEVEHCADGSVHVKRDDRKFISYIDKAVSEYATKVREFDPALAKVIEREEGTLFILDASGEFNSWMKEIV